MSRLCQWCGKPAIGAVVVEPEIVRKKKGEAPVIVKRAIEADVCAQHKEMVAAEWERTEKRRAINRLYNKRTPLDVQDRRKLAKLEDELRALDAARAA